MSMEEPAASLCICIPVDAPQSLIPLSGCTEFCYLSQKKMRLKIFLIMILLAGSRFMVSGQTEALVLIDIQDFYFADGALPLEGSLEAAEKAAALIAKFRNEGKMVVHVRHNYEPGGSIHRLVAPSGDEHVITKDQVNAFRDTSLDSLLRANGISTLVLVGMQTHMCLEAATRAAADLGYMCTVVGDACATRKLSYKGIEIPAPYVHASTLATLRSYAEVVTTAEILGKH